MSKNLIFLALSSRIFSVVHVKRARDKKFGKNEGASQIFGFYSIFITKYFLENVKKLDFF